MPDQWKSRLNRGARLPVLRCIRWMLTVIACLAWTGFACAQQQPSADDGPKFEIKHFVYEGATLVSKPAFDSATAAFVGPGKSFADVQRALEAVEKLYSANGWSAVQVLLPADRIDSESQAEGKVGKMWGHFSDGMSLKASSIKVRVHF